MTGAARTCEELGRRPLCREAEVRQHDVVALVRQQYVLALHVAVHPAAAVHVIHREQQLAEVAADLIFRHRLALALLHQLQQIATGGELGHEVELLV